MPDEPSEPSGLPPKKPRFRIRGGDRNKTLDALSALSRASPTPGHRSDFIQEINQEKNDRGAAILAVTNVENILETCIVRSIIDDGRFYDKLFGFNAPISTFDNKIRIAYALEIISTQMYENLNVIRALRNAFAHSKIPITFETKEVEEAFINDWNISVTTRMKFITICNIIAANLAHYACFAAGCRIISREHKTNPQLQVVVRPKPLP